MKFGILALTAMLCAACQREGNDSVWWSNQKTIIELQQKLELARYRLERQEQAAGDRPSAAEPSPADRLQAEIVSLARQKQLIRREITGMRDGWEGFRSEVLQKSRARAIGHSFSEMETGDGRILRDVRVTKIDDGGVSLVHENGTARLRTEDLDAEMRGFFGLDENLAQIAYARESESRAAYENWVGKELAAHELEERKLADARREEEKEEQRSRESARLMAAATRASGQSTLSASFGALGETTPIYGSGYRYRRPSYYRGRSVRYGYYCANPVAYCSRISFYGNAANSRGSGHCTPIPIRRPVNPFCP